MHLPWLDFSNLETKIARKKERERERERERDRERERERGGRAYGYLLVCQASPRTTLQRQYQTKGLFSIVNLVHRSLHF